MAEQPVPVQLSPERLAELLRTAGEALEVFQETVAARALLEGSGRPASGDDEARLLAIEREDELQRLPPEQFVCSGCGRVFRTQKELYTHKYHNLWEDYILRYRTGRAKCLFCGEVFPSEEAFIDHWYRQPDHEDYALTFLQMGTVSKDRTRGQWWIVESEGRVLERRLKTDPKLRKAKFGDAAGDIVLKTIRDRIDDDAMFVGVVYGIPGAGKSSFTRALIETVILPLAQRRLAMSWLRQDRKNLMDALYLMQELRARGHDIGLGRAALFLMEQRGLNTRPRVFLSANIPETLKLVREARPFNTIMQDEDPALMGRGAATARDKIETLLQTMRQKRINFLFISPVNIDYVSNPNLIFEVTHKAVPFSRRVSRAIVYDREGHAFGWCQLQLLPVNHPAMEEYAEFKERILERWQQAMGAEGYEFDVEDVVREAERALKILFDRLDHEIVSQYTLSDLKNLMPALGVRDVGFYQDAVAKHLHMLIQREVQQRRKEALEEMTRTTGESVPVDLDLEFTLDDGPYLEVIRREWPLEMRKWVDAYERYMARESGWETYRKIAMQFGMSSPGNVNDKFKRIKGRLRELKGGMMEIELLRRYLACPEVVDIQPPLMGDYPHYPEDIAREGVPDRVIVLADGTVRVCAWKLYESNATIPLRDKHDRPCPEIVRALELMNSGAEVQLVLEGIVGDRFFSVLIDPMTTRKSRTVAPSETVPWPPDLSLVMEAQRDMTPTLTQHLGEAIQRVMARRQEKKSA